MECVFGCMDIDSSDKTRIHYTTTEVVHHVRRRHEDYNYHRLKLMETPPPGLATSSRKFGPSDRAEMVSCPDNFGRALCANGRLSRSCASARPGSLAGLRTLVEWHNALMVGP